MTSIFPLVYSFLFLFCLSFLFFFLIKEFKVNLKVERRLLSLEKKLQQNKTSSSHLYKLGQLYLDKKFYDKAIRLLRTSLIYWDFNDKIGLGSLYNTLGFTYFKLNQADDAIYYYTQALQVLPDYTLALTNLGLVYENQQDYPKAFEVYQSVLTYDFKNKVALSRAPIVKVKASLIT